MNLQNRKEKILSARIGIVTFVVFVFVLICYAILNNYEDQSILLAVIPMGMLGATVRDYAAFKQDNDHASKNLAEQIHLIFIGAIMAMVITIMFATSAIEGSFFPRVTGGELRFESIKSALRGDVSLQTNADFYKLVIWAFIAGLFDNFVYRMLSSFWTK